MYATVGPRAPIVHCEPLYSALTGRLISIITLFEEVVCLEYCGAYKRPL
jgi:hypothetical protein